MDGEKSDPRECVELSQHEDGIERENKRTKLAAEKAPSALTVAMQETSHQVASYAFEVLSNAGLRSHSLGLLVCGKCVQPLYFRPLRHRGRRSLRFQGSSQALRSFKYPYEQDVSCGSWFGDGSV